MNCLVTKLNQVVVDIDNELKKLGELRIVIPAGKGTNAMVPYTADKSITMTVINGTGGFIIDDSGTIHHTITFGGTNGTVYIKFIADTDVEISIVEKYKLMRIPANASVKLDDLCFCNSIKTINYNTATDRDKLYGNLKGIKDLINLTTLVINSDRVYGKLTDIINLDALTKIDFSNCANISGSFEDLSNALPNLELATMPWYITGDISAFVEGKQLYYLATLYRNFSWSRVINLSKMCALRGKPNLGNDVDNYLNSVKNGIVNPKGDEWNGTTIDIYGTRTSASDEAVTALKAKEVTIKINDSTI